MPSNSFEYQKWSEISVVTDIGCISLSPSSAFEYSTRVRFCGERVREAKKNGIIHRFGRKSVDGSIIFLFMDLQNIALIFHGKIYPLLTKHILVPYSDSQMSWNHSALLALQSPQAVVTSHITSFGRTGQVSCSAPCLRWIMHCFS